MHYLSRWQSDKESACQRRKCKETQVQFLGPEDALDRKWQPTRVFLPGKFHGQRSLAGYSPWAHKVSDTTEYTHTYKEKINNLGLVLSKKFKLSSFITKIC